MSEVKKAIIIASGLGSRMYPYTKVESKLLIPLLNKPVVEYLVEELAASGIKEVIIVSNHTEKLKQFFKEDERLNQLLKSLKRDDLIKKLHHVELLLDVEIIRQDQPMGWVHELWYARDHIKKEPFVVLFSDVL